MSIHLSLHVQFCNSYVYNRECQQFFPDSYFHLQLLCKQKFQNLQFLYTTTYRMIVILE